MSEGSLLRLTLLYGGADGGVYRHPVIFRFLPRMVG
jgi:hypothetical protein